MVKPGPILSRGHHSHLSSLLRLRLSGFFQSFETALGAQRGDVLRMIVRRGLTLAVVGVGLGVATSAMLTRLISGMLFECGRLIRLLFVATAALLLVVSIAASSAPAFRASRLDPVKTLRRPPRR